MSHIGGEGESLVREVEAEELPCEWRGHFLKSRVENIGPIACVETKLVVIELKGLESSDIPRSQILDWVLIVVSDVVSFEHSVRCFDDPYIAANDHEILDLGVRCQGHRGSHSLKEQRWLLDRLAS